MINVASTVVNDGVTQTGRADELVEVGTELGVAEELEVFILEEAELGTGEELEVNATELGVTELEDGTGELDLEEEVATGVELGAELGVTDEVVVAIELEVFAELDELVEGTGLEVATEVEVLVEDGTELGVTEELVVTTELEELVDVTGLEVEVTTEVATEVEVETTTTGGQTAAPAGRIQGP